MTTPTDRITVKGEELTRRVWSLIDDAFKEAGIDPALRDVVQGSWSDGAQSAGTHSGGGAFDLRIKTIPQTKWEPLTLALRRRNCCAWVRSPAHGWTLSGTHLHAIVRDEAELSPGARQQVADYDAGLNGLANNGPDYHARPVQHHYTMPSPATPPPWYGPNIGWTTGDPRNIKAVQRVLHLPVTGNYSNSERFAIGDAAHGYASTHLDPWRKDGAVAGRVGPNLYASLMVHYA